MNGRNWHSNQDGSVTVDGRYDGPELTIIPSCNYELQVTMEWVDDRGRSWSTDGFFNAWDLVEAVKATAEQALYS